MGTGAKEGTSIARERCPIFEPERRHELNKGRKRGHGMGWGGIQRTAEASRYRATGSTIGKKNGEVYNAQGIP
jgi:hypothetical protein